MAELTEIILAPAVAESGASLGARGLDRVLLEGEGRASGDGYAWISSPPLPRIPWRLEDLWFYGHSARRQMPGTGAAVAYGEGEL